MRSILLLTAFLLVAALSSMPALADDAQQESGSLMQRYRERMHQTLDRALQLIGIRYRPGGDKPETGFDCSGFVEHVFREGLGLILPRSSSEMSKTGEPVAKAQLQPGDLVFFNTLRRAVSHVGIYLGNNLFVHAPRAGGQVRIEDMRDTYWMQHYKGARRVGSVDDNEQPEPP